MTWISATSRQIRSNQGSKKSLIQGLSDTSYSMGMRGSVPEINMKHCREGENAAYCRSQQQVRHSGRSPGQKEAYIKSFHMQVIL
jgi:hypothetical protein